MADEWGPWIEHDGFGCPCPGQVVHIKLGTSWDGIDPCECEGGWTSCVIDVIANDEAVIEANPGPGWSWSDGYFPIIRYRLRRPTALRQLVDLVETLPAPRVTEPA